MDKKIQTHLISTLDKTDINIIQGAANDLTPADIGEPLGYAARTIEAMTYNLRKKFECRTTMGLVALFFRKGLIK